MDRDDLRIRIEVGGEGERENGGVVRDGDLNVYTCVCPREQGNDAD